MHLFLKIFLGLVVITPAVTPGMSTSFSAIALPQLNLNLNEASWFGKENIRSKFVFDLNKILFNYIRTYSLNS